MSSHSSLSQPPAEKSTWLGESTRYLALGLASGAGVASLLAGSAASLAAYFARQVITPAPLKEPNTEILAVIERAEEQSSRPSSREEKIKREIVLGENPDVISPGRYGLWFDEGRYFARIGEILEHKPGSGTVTRELLGTSGGNLHQAVGGFWTGSLSHDPDYLALAYEEHLIPVAGGHAPAWYFPAKKETSTTALIIHGRGASRLEGLRAVRSLHEMGLNVFVLSYRNDGEAPAGDDGRYSLGFKEWEDVDSAMNYALSRGSEDFVLVGFSMGGAVALQANDRAAHAGRIKALILDAPVINWIDVLAHQARLNKVPSSIGRVALWLLSNKAGRALTGLAAPLDFKAMNWVERADQLRTPTLIIHSVDDEFVPIGPSLELARKNPDMVTIEKFSLARHTKEFNVDPQRWENVVTSWLKATLKARKSPASYRKPARSS